MRVEAEKKTDPAGGHDATTSSCQNVSLTCKTEGSAKTSDVFLQLDGFKGCTGTIGTKKLTIDCLEEGGKGPQVCVDAQCT